jgi:hypothetical protein
LTPVALLIAAFSLEIDVMAYVEPDSLTPDARNKLFLNLVKLVGGCSSKSGVVQSDDTTLTRPTYTIITL